MKTRLLIALLTAGVLFLTSGVYQAQTPVVLHEKKAISIDTVVLLKLFTGKHNGDKNYLHWVIAKGNIDGLYVLYRSCDGVGFELVGSRKGIGIPVRMDVGHYMIDDCPYPGINYYKLVYTTTDGSLSFSSEVININIDL